MLHIKENEFQESPMVKKGMQKFNMNVRSTRNMDLSRLKILQDHH